jgi:hypothetical protein
MCETRLRFFDFVLRSEIKRSQPRFTRRLLQGAFGVGEISVAHRLA